MYYLLFAILYSISLLPLTILYGLSNFTFLILYRVVGYRKKIVLDNLQFAFPEKSSDEIRKIMKRFYRSFCDQWIETVKLMSMSEKQLNKRFSGNWQVFKNFNEEHKNTYVLLGHNFNWEWGNVVTQWNTPQLFAGMYLPQSNKSFERIMLYIRKRSGALLISAWEMRDSFKLLQNKTHVVAFMADQTPANDFVKWISFMNRPAPFFLAPEKAAKRAAAAVVFAAIRKIKRGHYYTDLQIITDDASKEKFGTITERYVQHLQNEIKQQPENWMWTHRRWKKTPPQEFFESHESVAQS